MKHKNLWRDYLSDLTDDLEGTGAGSYIEKFVAGGPKNCTLSFALRRGKVKVT